jgi:hypothetical protein
MLGWGGEVKRTNINIAHRTLRVIWDCPWAGDLSELFTANFEFRNLNGPHDVTDLRGLRGRIASLRSTYPRGHLIVDQALESPDRVTLWWVFSENGCGRADPEPTTASRIITEGTCMFHIQEGQIAEMWELGGQLGSVQ